ncbi:MAG: hypothetical protein LBR93_11330 [Treponema sp.]|jgi:hypothetical protein|nr:hypothetical protein [Treponema sp.]
MAGQTWISGFVRVVYLSAAFIIALVFSGCPDPITALEGTPAPLPPEGERVVNNEKDLTSALEGDENIKLITVGPNISLTIRQVTVKTDKTLKVSSGSMVTVQDGLSVPPGLSLILRGETGKSAGQINLGSLDIQGALEVGENIQVTLMGSGSKVGGKFSLAGGGIVLVNKGATIQGVNGDSSIDIDQGGIAFAYPGDNNFYRKIGNSPVTRLRGSFSWVNGRWEETGEIFSTSLAEFLAAEHSTTYVVNLNDSLPLNAELKAVSGQAGGVKTLVLDNSYLLAGDSLDLAAGAKLELEGTGTLAVKGIVLKQGAKLEVGPQAVLSANTNKNSELKPGSKIVIRGTFHNDSMPGWTMDTGAEFVFHAGSRIHINKGSSLSEYFIGTANDGNKPIIILKDGSIVLGPGEFRLAEKGVAVLNSNFEQPWPGKVYIDGTLDLNAKFTVKQPGSPPQEESYFELAENAGVLVNAGGELFVQRPSAGGSVKYGVLGSGSKIVVKNGGTFNNGIFPNWGHGSSGNPGAFVFEAGSSIYAPNTVFGSNGNGNDQLYIGNDQAAVELKNGQIRLTDKTFALEALGSTNGEAVLKKDLSLSGSRLVVDNSSLTIESSFSVENTSATEEFVALAGAKILVKNGGKFIIASPKSLPGGDVKLALLSSNSSITVESGGEFHNGIYPNWEMTGSGSFVFKSGSKIYKNSEASPFIGDSNSSPVRLAKGTITYAYKKVTLDGEADVNDQTVLPLWAGFELVLEPNSVLTVHIPAGDFTLAGITVTNTGAEIVYTTTSP